MSVYLHNWSGHHTFSTSRVHAPESVAELQDIVRRSRKIKVLGARHSFNDIADSTEDLITLDKLDPTITIDPEARTVTAHAGITYGSLCQQLHAAGYAIHNMASLPHITVAGAIATATHGSGDNNGNLATAVAAIELVKADGELVTLSRTQNKEDFEGAVVGLGGVGVMARVTLDIVPAFSMQQEVYEYLPVAELENNFDTITASAYSVSFFTDWKEDRVNQVWLKRRLVDDKALDVAPTFYGATLAAAQVHPVSTLDAAPCTDQRGIVGPWYERLPHFRIDHTPASGNELQTEYFVARHHAIDAMREIAKLAPMFASTLWISEIRTVAADTLWMSPSYQQPVVGLHFSWLKNWESVQKVLPVLEEALAPFQARPHWGKLFAMPPAVLQSRYPRMADFRDLLQRYDSTGKFRNPYLDKYIFGVG
jgi:xylitol oxidase